jgi:hypothetical protein
MPDDSMDLPGVAALALALPDATEQDHHGMRSFRVDGKIFATVPDPQHVRIFVGEQDILAAVAAHPDVCAEVWWGKKLSAVVVEIERAPRQLVKELLDEAWRMRAPKGRSSHSFPLT